MPAPEPLTVAGLRARFDAVAAFTVGAEDEVMVVHPETLDLMPAPVTLLARLAGDDRFRRELPAAQLEITTPVCRSAAEVEHHMRRGRRALAERADGIALLAAAGTHPFAAAEGVMSDGVRYGRITDHYGWAARRAMVFGLHVHVAVPGADRALAVHDAVRGYLPEIAALAGNAPFLAGEDTGLSSIRPLLSQNLPRQGVAPALGSWERYRDLLDWGARGGAFPDHSHLWWETRLHPGYGTLEIRVPDAQTTVAETAALVAVVHALVVWLARRWDAGDPLEVHEDIRIAENRWRALRFGLGGIMIDPVTGAAEPTRDRVARLLDTLAPVAAAVGGAVQLRRAWDLLDATGSTRQRVMAGECGLRELTAWMVGAFMR